MVYGDGNEKEIALLPFIFMSNPRKSIPRLRDNHFRSSDDEYELIAHESFESDVSMEEMTRRKWFGPGWLKRLDKLKKKHRKQGLQESFFFHPKKCLE